MKKTQVSQVLLTSAMAQWQEDAYLLLKNLFKSGLGVCNWQSLILSQNLSFWCLQYREID